MLSAKLGSLDDAFHYMDNASRGDSFAFVSWHTGLLVLRIDSWSKCSLKASASFRLQLYSEILLFSYLFPISASVWKLRILTKLQVGPGRMYG